MRIQKKRIRRVEANLPGVKTGQLLRATFPIGDMKVGHLARAGFTAAAETGETILPSIVGRVTRYNAEGKEIVHRDLPKETCYRQHEWTYTQFHGPDRVEVTDMVDVPYERYPRTRTPVPGVELTIAERADGTKVVAAPIAVFNAEAPDALILNINLMLELFGGCDIVDEALNPIGVVATRSLNWTVLPRGRMPWDKLKIALAEVLEGQTKGKKPVVEYRLAAINNYGPEFVAKGEGGFSGYVVFGFPSLGLYVMECVFYANATYVVEQDWEQLSRLTKAQLLNGNLHKERLVHVSRWGERIRTLLGGDGGQARAA